MPDLSWFFAPQYVVAAGIWYVLLALIFFRAKEEWLSLGCHGLLVLILWYLMAAAQMKSTTQVLNLGNIGWFVYKGAILVSLGMIMRIWSKVLIKRKKPP